MAECQPVLELVTGPDEPPINLNELKQRLRITFNDDDGVLNQMMQAAVNFLDGPHALLGRCIITQTWDQLCGCFPPPGADLPLFVTPAQSIVEIEYRDANDVRVIWPPENYELGRARSGPFVRGLAPWPAISRKHANPVRVRVEAGYGVASDTPAALREALYEHCGTLYEHREALNGRTDVVPLGYDDLIRIYRNPSL